MKKEFQAGTKDEQRTTDEFRTSASVEANPMLGTVRLLKFRAWDNQDKRMLNQKDYSGDLHSFFYVCQDVFKSHELFINQYIGLLDKNEVEIFEGDIVKCWDNAAEDKTWGLDKFHIGYIKYTPDCFSLCIPPKKEECTLTDALKHYPNPIHLSDWSNAENIEVIGNIYQTPELVGW